MARVGERSPKAVELDEATKALTHQITRAIGLVYSDSIVQAIGRYIDARIDWKNDRNYS